MLEGKYLYSGVDGVFFSSEQQNALNIYSWPA